jgi:hypothetical protein
LVQSTGLISHIGERWMVTPSISTLRQRYGWMNCGRRNDPSAKTRCSTGTPASTISPSRSRAARCVSPLAHSGCVFHAPFHGHQCVSSPCPSSVPSPVTATFSCSKA